MHTSFSVRLLPKLFGFAALTCLLLNGCNDGSTSADTSADDGITIAATNPALRYSGRWRMDDQPSVGWASSSLEFQFSGSGAEITLESQGASDRWRVVIDGKPENVIDLDTQKQTFTLARALDPNRLHHVLLMKETNEGVTRVHQLKLSDGSLQALPEQKQKMLLFFGDSNMDGTSLYSEKDSGDSGSYYAYPATVARMLNARFAVQAYGGATWIENGGNNVQDFIYSPVRGQPDDNYRDNAEPDVIIVNAGANDIYQINSPDKQVEVSRRIREGVMHLRAVYGEQPHIVLFNAYGWDLNEPANYTKALAAEIGGNISAHHYPWMWEKWHGSMVEHAGQARLLAEHLIDLNLGFDHVSEPEIFDGFGRAGDVANGSFEHKAAGDFPAFGWRYADDGVTRIEADDAADGRFYIQLDAGEQVHQGTDATGDFEAGPSAGGTLNFSLKLRSREPQAQAIVQVDFEGQALYGRGGSVQAHFTPTADWQTYNTSFSVPAGAWKSYIVLKAETGRVDIDQVQSALE